MNPDELRDTLSMHDADPDTVLVRLRAKQQARDRRRRLAGSVAACALVAVAGASAWAVAGRSPSEAPPSTSSGPGPSEGDGRAFAAGDACPPLPQNIGSAARDGLSVVTATGTLTGKAGTDGYPFREMVLTGVRTLSGAPVADGAVVWTRVPDRPASPDPMVAQGGPDGPLFAPDGRLLGLYVPQSVNQGPLGATLLHVPVVGDAAVMPAAGCWNSFSAQGVPGSPFTGDLDEVPGSGTAAQLADREFVAVPLRTVESFVPR